MLEATEWGLWITGQCINEHATSDDLRRNNAAVLRIRRQDIGLQAISRVIGDRYRFRLVAIGDERQNRSEDQREVPRAPAEVEARWRLLGLLNFSASVAVPSVWKWAL